MKISISPNYRNGAILVLIVASSFLQSSLKAQLLTGKPETFTHADTLRGSNNENRDWWDVMRYDIRVTPDYDTKTIKGETTISFTSIKKGGKAMQIDLQEGLLITDILLENTYQSKNKDAENKPILSPVTFQREGNIYLLNMEKMNFDKTTVCKLKITYHGKPREAIRPPWDGGWIWKKDAQGRPWMSVACQGLGASVWYPCKDIQSDEPNKGASLTISVPDSMIAVANGRLTNSSKANGIATFTWEVQNPINNYNIVPYIGKYVHFGETYKGEQGNLNCDYWVLDYNLEKAKEQFKQVPKMLKAFEYWFGPYPFYADGYKLVDAPHLGMEHQSAVAYGNGYQNGYLGRGSAEGLQWDYIIIHESGHEWFANNITTNDIADMWVHEGFTCYSETLFTEYWYGKEAADRYLQAQRKGIRNKATVIGQYGVNNEGSGDMYPKGANLLHTVRQVINNDSIFRGILRGLNKTFYHQTVTSKQVEDYISRQSGIPLSKIFDQYLRTIQIPALQWKYDGGQLQTKWSNCITDFAMPIRFKDITGKSITITPNASVWLHTKANIDTTNNNFWDKNFYVGYEKK